MHSQLSRLRVYLFTTQMPELPALGRDRREAGSLPSEGLPARVRSQGGKRIPVLRCRTQAS